MPVAWDDDNPADEKLIARNVKTVLEQMLDGAAAREAPTVAMAQTWHRNLYRDIVLPVEYFAGEVRDSDTQFPELYGYEVQVGVHLGVLSGDVPRALEEFERTFTSAVLAVDERLFQGDITAEGAELYVTLVAVAHGEWIRIHPFANGNGRTARLWTHWLAARYNLPPLLRVKPRPRDRLYGSASSASMTGDHTIMRAWLLAQILGDEA